MTELTLAWPVDFTEPNIAVLEDGGPTYINPATVFAVRSYRATVPASQIESIAGATTIVFGDPVEVAQKCFGVAA